MTHAVTTEPSTSDNADDRQSLGTAGARNLSTTTKTPPQTQNITPRWLSRVLPWVNVPGGTYRVNRRLTYQVGDGRIDCVNTGADVQVIAAELTELPLLRGFGDQDVLDTLAGRFEQRELAAGETIAEAGRPAEGLVVLAHGKATKTRPGPYGDAAVLATIADGEHIGAHALTQDDATWSFTVTSATACTVLVLPRQAFADVLDRSAALQDHLRHQRENPPRPHTKHGEAVIDIASGHHGEVALPGTFADYELAPREYSLSLAQTVLRVHTRISDLYNQPMSQFEQQLRLTVEALRERQEHELVNNRDFGLLYNADLSQRIHPRSGPPTPGDLDELLTRRRSSKFFLAHPRAIAAFGRECNRRGLYPATTTVDGSTAIAWRGVPILPCDKIPVTEANTSHIFVLRTGEDDNGVVGLHQTGIPDEYRPGLSVRHTGIDDRAIASYLVTAYFSAAILVPDALGVLEHVEIGG